MDRKYRLNLEVEVHKKNVLLITKVLSSNGYHCTVQHIDRLIFKIYTRAFFYFSKGHLYDMLTHMLRSCGIFTQRILNALNNSNSTVNTLNTFPVPINTTVSQFISQKTLPLKSMHC
jgi:hypothetical protein